MTVVVASRAAAGVRPGDHACCTYGSDDDQRAVVGRFGADAVARGERLIYLADRTEERSIRSYLDDAGVNTSACLRSGQIELRSFGNTNMVTGAFDPERQIAELGVEKTRARADGFTALALIGEMSWAAGRPRDADRIALYEREVSRIFSTTDITGVCQYDTRLLPDELISRLVEAHQFQIAVCPSWSRTDKGPMTLIEHESAGLSLSGEIDIANEDYLRCRLEAHLGGQGDVVVDVGGLSFIDVRGCRALRRAAEMLPEGRRLILANPPYRLVRTLALCGWSNHPRIVLGAPIAGTPDGHRGCA